MQIEAVFRPLMEMEKEISRLYERLAEVFDGDRDASFLWMKMATEEKGHANLVDYQRRVIQKNSRVAAEVDLALDELAAVSAVVRQSLEGPPPSLEEAVLLAFAVETSAAESHFRNALRQSHPDLQRLLESLGGEDRAHLERLKAFAAKGGIALPEPKAG